MQKKVLVIDDEYDICSMVSMVLASYTVYKATCIERAEQILRNEQIDLIILDVWLGTGITGIDFLSKIREVSNVPVIVMSGHGSIDLAIKAVKLGAEDFLEKPFSGDKLIVLVDRMIKNHVTMQQSKLIPVSKHFSVGQSDKWQSFQRKLERVDSKRVVLYGQLGVGKGDAIAFLIRQLNVINEIFYFTEKDMQKISTLKSHDVAIIHIQNTDLISKIQGDSYIFIKTRTKVPGIEVPSLAQRNTDIKELFDYFINDMKVKFLTDFYHDITLADLQKYSWPGNILELEILVRQLAIDSIDNGFISRDNLLDKINAIDLYSFDIKKAKNIFEKQFLDINLKRCNNNIAKMARQIGMERSALYRKMKRDITDSYTHLEK